MYFLAQMWLSYPPSCTGTQSNHFNVAFSTERGLYNVNYGTMLVGGTAFLHGRDCIQSPCHVLCSGLSWIKAIEIKYIA